MNAINHAGYPETTNATENNKRYRNQFAVLGSECLYGNNLLWISLIRGKCSHTGIYTLLSHVDFNRVVGVSRVGCLGVAGM